MHEHGRLDWKINVVRLGNRHDTCIGSIVEKLPGTLKQIGGVTLLNFFASFYLIF